MRPVMGGHANPGSPTDRPHSWSSSPLPPPSLLCLAALSPSCMSSSDAWLASLLQGSATRHQQQLQLHSHPPRQRLSADEAQLQLAHQNQKQIHIQSNEQQKDEEQQQHQPPSMSTVSPLASSSFHSYGGVGPSSSEDFLHSASVDQPDGVDELEADHPPTAPTPFDTIEHALSTAAHAHADARPIHHRTHSHLPLTFDRPHTQATVRQQPPVPLYTTTTVVGTSNPLDAGLPLPPLPPTNGVGAPVQHVIALINGVNTWVPLSPEYYPVTAVPVPVPAVIAPVLLPLAPAAPPAPVGSEPLLPVPAAPVTIPQPGSKPAARIQGLQAIQTMLQASSDRSKSRTTSRDMCGEVDPSHQSLSNSLESDHLDQSTFDSSSASVPATTPSRSRLSRSRTPTRTKALALADRPEFDASFTPAHLKTPLSEARQQARIEREARAAVLLERQMAEGYHFSRREAMPPPGRARSTSRVASRVSSSVSTPAASTGDADSSSDLSTSLVLSPRSYVVPPGVRMVSGPNTPQRRGSFAPAAHAGHFAAPPPPPPQPAKTNTHAPTTTTPGPTNSNGVSSAGLSQRRSSSVSRVKYGLTSSTSSTPVIDMDSLTLAELREEENRARHTRRLAAQKIKDAKLARTLATNNNTNNEQHAQANQHTPNTAAPTGGSSSRRNSLSRTRIAESTALAAAAASSTPPAAAVRGASRPRSASATRTKAIAATNAPASTAAATASTPHTARSTPRSSISQPFLSSSIGGSPVTSSPARRKSVSGVSGGRSSDVVAVASSPSPALSSPSSRTPPVIIGGSKLHTPASVAQSMAAAQEVLRKKADREEKERRIFELMKVNQTSGGGGGGGATTNSTTIAQTQPSTAAAALAALKAENETSGDGKHAAALPPTAAADTAAAPASSSDLSSSAISASSQPLPPLPPAPASTIIETFIAEAASASEPPHTSTACGDHPHSDNPTMTDAVEPDVSIQTDATAPSAAATISTTIPAPASSTVLQSHPTDSQLDAPAAAAPPPPSIQPSTSGSPLPSASASPIVMLSKKARLALDSTITPVTDLPPTAGDAGTGTHFNQANNGLAPTQQEARTAAQLESIEPLSVDLNSHPVNVVESIELSEPILNTSEPHPVPAPQPIEPIDSHAATPTAQSVIAHTLLTDVTPVYDPIEPSPQPESSLVHPALEPVDAAIEPEIIIATANHATEQQSTDASVSRGAVDPSPMLSVSASPATLASPETILSDDPISAAALHAQRKPKFVGEHELSEMADTLKRSSTKPNPLFNHLIFRVDEATREDRAHPLGKVRLHQKLLLVNASPDALTEKWREQWLSPNESLLILIMTQSTGPNGELVPRFIFLEWVGDCCPAESSRLVQELTGQVERVLRKIMPLALTLQATHPAQITQEAFAEDLNQESDADSTDHEIDLQRTQSDSDQRKL